MAHNPAQSYIYSKKNVPRSHMQVRQLSRGEVDQLKGLWAGFVGGGEEKLL